MGAARVEGTGPNRDVEIAKLARHLYCADYWGVPTAGEKWDDGRAYSHEYDRFFLLAEAAWKFFEASVVSS